MCKRSKILLMLALTLTLPFHLMASGGKISGLVTDKATGEALVAANIMITERWDDNTAVELDQIRGSFSDENGYFVLLNISPGSYTLKVSMMGYTDFNMEKVHVNMGRSIQLEFPMTQEALSLEAVTVTAEREIIKADLASSQEIIGKDRLEDAPLLRMDEFISNMKGVELVAGNDGSGLSIRGGDVSETDIQVDGVSSRDARSGNSYLSINSSSVEELQVLTGGFEAKHGGIQSGLVNVVTKEGSREKYDFSGRVNFTPAGQQRFFGDNPWSEDGLIYRIFADTSENGFAYVGAGADTAGIIPLEFQGFKGWDAKREGRQNYKNIGLDREIPTAEQKRQMWIVQHPKYEVAQRPDIFIEGTLTGPVPLTKKSTFMLAGKLERTELAFPLGPRDSYMDYNTHLKITTRPDDKTKLSISGMYAHVATNTSSRPSSAGGGLADTDVTTRFGFLSNSQQAVYQQASILSNWAQMYNKSFIQTVDQSWFMGGLKLNRALSPRSYFSLEAQFNYQESDILPMSADPSDTNANWVNIDTSLSIINYPSIGTPNGSTNYGKDINDLFYIFGGLQAVDSSYTVSTSVKGNYTAQLGQNHEFETGFNLNYTHSFVYCGTWYQSEQLYTPDTWQYYKANPIEAGIYVQDKLEFQGMVATIGLRGDYFNPQKNIFVLEHPIDQAYPDLYNLVYQYLPGSWGSFERWEVFREMLEEPESWPLEKYRGEFKVSPRLGVSFPVTENSKMYFNYGHFYQRPNYSYLYNLTLSDVNVILPTPELPMAKTVSYEFGYEQAFLKDYLANIVIYYKDMANIPLSRTYINYWEEYEGLKYSPDGYSDIRGVELRLEKSAGRFFTMWCNFDYMLKSWGQSGVAYIYENRVTALDEERSANISTIQPLPRANIALSFHTPMSYGPAMKGIYPLGGWRINFNTKWVDGGKATIKVDPLTGLRDEAEIVDFTNTDIKAGKRIKIFDNYMDIGITVTNLFNQKRLNIGGMNTIQYTNYKNSLRFPFEEGEEQGDDKWGEWNKEHIELGWFQTPIFLNPRRVIISLSMDI